MKGFAFTLGVGTIVSLFTAVVFTQAIPGLFGRSRFLRSPALALGAGEQRVRWHFDFTGLAAGSSRSRGDPADRGDRRSRPSSSTSGSTSSRGAGSRPALERDASVDDVRSTLEGVGIDDAEIHEASSIPSSART